VNLKCASYGFSCNLLDLAAIFQTSVEIPTLLLPTRESFEKHDNIIYCSMTNIQMKLGHESHVNVCNSLVAHVYDKYQLL
jgi:hypothetical protein